MTQSKNYVPGLVKVVGKVDHTEVNVDEDGNEVLNGDINVFFNSNGEAPLKEQENLVVKDFGNLSNELADEFQRNVVSQMKVADKDLNDHHKEFFAFRDNFSEEKFVDAEFPANMDSIIGHGMANGKPVDSSASKLNSKQIKWIRAPEIMQNVNVIVDGISPADIFQGGIGNCYFLSSISAIAEKPERV